MAGGTNSFFGVFFSLPYPSFAHSTSVPRHKAPGDQQRKTSTRRRQHGDGASCSPHEIKIPHTLVFQSLTTPVKPDSRGGILGEATEVHQRCCPQHAPLLQNRPCRCRMDSRQTPWGGAASCLRRPCSATPPGRGTRRCRRSIPRTDPCRGRRR
ncbi:unnamed protein product [Ectocarpus sp. 12 AP-2014]